MEFADCHPGRGMLSSPFMKRIAVVLIGAAGLSGLFGCPLQKPVSRLRLVFQAQEKEAAPDSKESRKDLASENELLKQKVAELEARLALEARENAAQGELLARMREDLLAAVDEATQARTGPEQPGEQAAAVKARAEVKIRLEKARAHPLADLMKDHLASAEKMVAASSRQLEAGNFGGAYYFALSAQRTVDGAMKIAGIEAERQGRLLSVAAAQANLRLGPSLQTDVVGRLSQGTRLIPYEKSGEWVRVYVPDTGEAGWVYAALVR